jgi:hypothetical protein
MTKAELRERIETRLMLFTSNDRPLPPAQSAVGRVAREAAERHWTGGLLHNVTQLELVPEIKNTSAGDALTKAILLAKTGDASHLSEIEAHLHQVLIALRKGPQA